MAGRSVELNGLSSRIRVHAMDLRNAPEVFGYETFHAVVCNPPYGKQNGTLKNQTETVLLARHEQDTSLGEIVKSAGALLRTMGRLSMVFPAQRFLELCDELRRCRLEPKRVRMVCAKLEKPPYLEPSQLFGKASSGRVGRMAYSHRPFRHCQFSRRSWGLGYSERGISRFRASPKGVSMVSFSFPSRGCFF